MTDVAQLRAAQRGRPTAHLKRCVDHLALLVYVVCCLPSNSPHSNYRSGLALKMDYLFC